MSADPTPCALLVGTDSPVRIWGLSGRQRLDRQLHRAGIAQIEPIGGAGALGNDTVASSVVLLRVDWIFDEPLILALRASPPGTLLYDASGTTPVAAHVKIGEAARAEATLSRGEPPEAHWQRRTPETLAGRYNTKLRKRETPYLLPLTLEMRGAIERRMFAGSYKGVTDLVTKYVWPWPARHVTRWCALAGITPNQVTAASGVLVIVAFLLFWYGHYGPGLVVAWAMTFLDTVDGKLARVTLTSSKLGDVLDHGIDLIHPPFWWWAWIVGLGAAAHPLANADLVLWVVIAGYWLQRLEEGFFQRQFGMHMHVWRRFDSFFRLITARRNPNLLILTVATLWGRPDTGMVCVAVWMMACFFVHATQIWQALAARRRGPIVSWLSAS